MCISTSRDISFKIITKWKSNTIQPKNSGKSTLMSPEKKPVMKPASTHKSIACGLKTFIAKEKYIQRTNTETHN